MAQDLSKLNKEQKEAVLHQKGPLLIVAGAGTGKTTVITQKVAYLIEKGYAKPEEILAVTFTDKAAGELEERVGWLLSESYVDLWVSTFHSFCERVLRDNALDIGLAPDFKIVDQIGSWLLVRQNIDSFELDYYKPLGNPTKFIKGLISHFSRCKDQEVYPEDYLEYAEKLKTNLTDLPESSEVERIKEIANAYHIYQKLLLENDSLDFGDLINYCLKLFLKRPFILKKYSNKFKYILVDEFQDTNWSQYELVKVLAKPNNNITVSADDDQAIYRFRGASFSNIIQFKKDFPKAKQISLVKNYRSGQNILDKSYEFIKGNNPDRLECVNKINKRLIAQEKEKGVVEHIHEKSLDREIKKTIEKILEILKKDKDSNYSDFAILLRANNSATPFIKEMERIGIPYQFLASRGLYSKPIILDVISYFKLLDNYHESSAVYRILNLPFLKIPQEDIINITQYAKRKTKSLYEAMEELPLNGKISSKTQENISFLLSLIKKHTLMAKDRPVSEILVSFLEDSGYLKYLVQKEDQNQLDLLNQFYKRIKSFEEETLEPSLKNFIEEIFLEIESGEEGKLDFDPDLGPDMVKIMTIHGAKGLEFKYVFLVNMVDKRFPTIERKDLIELPEQLIKDIKPKGDVHLQEERRICYVGMTRAKNNLYFTSAEDYGGTRKKRLSRFLVEMGYKEQKTSAFKNNGLLEKREVAPKGLKAKKESEFLPKHFSFSQLAAFEKCPLQYKFAFILRIPVRGKAVFSFGKTIHNTLYNFLKQEEQNKNQENLFGLKEVRETGGKRDKLTLDSLLEIYEKNWIDDWYESKKQKQEYYKLGKKTIKDFFEDYLKNKPNILKINNERALEIPFNLKIGNDVLYGVIDRIDKKDDGVIIIDYKTGSMKEKFGSEEKEQLLIYQIAAQEFFKLEVKELVYYYLEDGKKKSFLGTEKDQEKQIEKIKEKIEKMKNSEFNPTPGWQCSYCDFKDICDFRQKA